MHTLVVSFTCRSLTFLLLVARFSRFPFEYGLWLKFICLSGHVSHCPCFSF